MGVYKLSYYFPFLHGYKEINSVHTGLPNRHEAGNDYRYGYGGQEKDDEVAGEGNSYTAQFWQYDSRLGRRWNPDPITYSWQSTYSTNNNNPIVYTDPTGLYGENKAKRKRKRAARRYGEDRVTDVYYNKDKDDWGFGVVNDKTKDKYTHKTSDGGVLAYKTTGIYNNKQFRNFDKNKSGYSYKEQLVFEEEKLADNINTGIGSINVLSLVLEASYLSSSTQVFRYSAEGMSAAQLTNSLAKSSLATAKVFTKINVITGVATTGYSYYKVYDAYTDPNKEVDPWDVSDAAVGATTTTVSILAFVGIVSNPIGWAVAIGGGIYFIYRAVSDE